MEKKAVMGYVEACSFIKQYINSTKKTQSQVAKELDVSPSALSGFLSGTYKTPHTIISRIEELAEISIQKKVAPKAPGYQETSISRVVTQAIRYSHLQGKISVVFGDAGVGKTAACKNYLRNNALAIGITVSPTYSSITGVNELITEPLGIRAKVSRKQTREIVEKLKDSGRVLIVDEAQQLTTRTIDHLRCISDESGAGICFIGNHKLNERINGTGTSDFAQLFSRRGMNPEVRVSDIKVEDVQTVFGEYVTDPRAVEILYRICHTNFGMRGAVNVFINTVAAFEQISAEYLASMAREMRIR